MSASSGKVIGPASVADILGIVGGNSGGMSRSTNKQEKARQKLNLPDQNAVRRNEGLVIQNSWGFKLAGV